MSSEINSIPQEGVFGTFSILGRQMENANGLDKVKVFGVAFFAALAAVLTAPMALCGFNLFDRLVTIAYPPALKDGVRSDIPNSVEKISVQLQDELYYLYLNALIDAKEKGLKSIDLTSLKTNIQFPPDMKANICRNAIGMFQYENRKSELQITGFPEKQLNVLIEIIL